MAGGAGALGGSALGLTLLDIVRCRRLRRFGYWTDRSEGWMGSRISVYIDTEVLNLQCKFCADRPPESSLHVRDRGSV